MKVAEPKVDFGGCVDQIDKFVRDDRPANFAHSLIHLKTRSDYPFCYFFFRFVPLRYSCAFK